MPNYYAVEVTPVKGKKYWAKGWGAETIFITSDRKLAEQKVIGIDNIGQLIGTTARVVPVNITVKEK